MAVRKTFESFDVCYKNETVVSVRLEIRRTCEICFIGALIHFVLPLILIFIWKMVKTIKFRIKVSHATGPKTNDNRVVFVKNQNMYRTNSIEKIPSQSCFSRFRSPIKTTDALNADDLKRIVFESRKEEQESPSDYKLGGYMPLAPATYLNDDYKALRKLGFGHFSTVWLCESLNPSKPRPKHVAVKICRSAAMYSNVAEDEIRLLLSAKRCDPNDPGYSKIVLMLDKFTLTSANGQHTCIAFELMGPSLFNLLQYTRFKGIDIESVKRIIRQICMGLSYLHEKCRIIHTDLKPENILIRANQRYIDELVAKAKKFEKSTCGRPKNYITSTEWKLMFADMMEDAEDDDDQAKIEYVPRKTKSYPSEKETDTFGRDSSVPNLNGPIWLNPNIEIKIGDLGNACWETQHFSSEIQTREYRALEVIMGAQYSFSADMWSVGCTAFEMATGELLFSPKGRDSIAIDTDHLCLIWETLGGIPRYITETGRHAATYFENGQLRDVYDGELKIWKVEDVLVDKYNWKRVDAIPLAGLIEGLIEPDPALRLTASAALNTPFLVEDNCGDY